MFSTDKILKNKKISIAINKAKAKEAIAIDNEKDTANRNLLSIEDKAIMLMQTLNADPNYLRFYCKCFHKLPENIIQNILEGARKATRPDCYFAKAAKIEMYKLEK